MMTQGAGTGTKRRSAVEGGVPAVNAIKTIKFDGASMDKLSYNALKGLDVDVSKVTVI